MSTEKTLLYIQNVGNTNSAVFLYYTFLNQYNIDIRTILTGWHIYFY